MANFLTRIGLFLLVCSFPMETSAHDPHTHLANQLGAARSHAFGLCCDGKDYIIPTDWQRSDIGYRVLIGTRWHDVPKEAEVTNMRNPDMEAKVWLLQSEGETWIRCFMPGTEV